jgi:hypothetical protein
MYNLYIYEKKKLIERENLNKKLDKTKRQTKNKELVKNYNMRIENFLFKVSTVL